MRFWRNWQAERAVQRRAAAYVQTLQREPTLDEVDWLAANGTRGDADHARWELRYARRALGLIAAGRDALDDRTASAVARVLADSLARDPNVAAEKLAVAERQLNARLRAYGDAVASRGRGGGPSTVRLGRTLLTFAGVETPGPDAIAHAGGVLAGYLAEANEALRQQFGAASLPDDVAPSLAGHPR